jgi:hypothetical protein
MARGRTGRGRTRLCHEVRWGKGSHPATRGFRTHPTRRRSRKIVAVMRAAGDSPDGMRLRGIIVVPCVRIRSCASVSPIGDRVRLGESETCGELGGTATVVVGHQHDAAPASDSATLILWNP